MFVVKWEQWIYDRCGVSDIIERYREFEDRAEAYRFASFLVINRDPRTYVGDVRDAMNVTVVATTDGDELTCPFNSFQDEYRFCNFPLEVQCPVCGQDGKRFNKSKCVRVSKQ